MSILQKIVTVKREEVESRASKLPLAELKARCAALSAPLGFAAALRRTKSPVIIAEIKRASPSRGIIREDLDPAETAEAYAAGGAAALSVLTDAQFFFGSIEFIHAIKTALGAEALPVLRKDFIIDRYQVWESRLCGADALLLIAAALSEEALAALLQEAMEASLDVLIEVHDAEEIARTGSAIRTALKARQPGERPAQLMLGINNRDLQTFVTDLGVFGELAGNARSMLAEAGIDEALLVAESGIITPADLGELSHQGADAFLIGESLVSSGDPGVNLRELIAGYRVIAR